MTKKMNWDDLRIFLSVARKESLSAAGKQLALDPATIGRRIARFETDIGGSLFYKSPRGYTLTEKGIHLVRHAEAGEQAMLAAQEALSQSLSNEDQSITGQIRLGVPDGCANYLLPQILAQISQDNPRLDVQILSLPRVVSLSQREADIAISVSSPKTGKLTTQKIANYHLSLAAHPDYLSQSSPVHTLRDLKKHRIIGYIPDMIYDQELNHIERLGLSAVQLASNSVSVQLHMLRVKAGIGVVHDFALPYAPELVRLLKNDFRLQRSFWLIRHENDSHSTKLNRFASLLVKGLQNEIHRLENIQTDMLCSSSS